MWRRRATSAEKLGVKIEVVETQGAADIENALIKVKETRPDAVLLASDTLMLSKRKEIADFMAENRIPAIYPFNEYAERWRLVHLWRQYFCPVRTCGRISGQAVEGREGRQPASSAGHHF